MGIFDRFKKPKKEENQEEIKMGQNLSASEQLSADLQRQIDDLYKEKNAAYQEQMNGWRKVEQEILGQLAARSDLDTTKYLDDVVAKQAKEVITEMAEDEFEKSFIGQKYKLIDSYLIFSYLGLKPSGPDNNIAEKTCTEFAKLGHGSGENVILPFLLEKEARGLLTPSEEKQLNSVRNSMTDMEFAEYLKEALLAMEYSGLLAEKFEPSLLLFPKTTALWCDAVEKNSNLKR